MGETSGPGRNPKSELDATEQRTDVVLTCATEGPTGEPAEEAKRSDGANPPPGLLSPVSLDRAKAPAAAVGTSPVATLQTSS